MWWVGTANSYNCERAPRPADSPYHHHVLIMLNFSTCVTDSANAAAHKLLALTQIDVINRYRGHFFVECDRQLLVFAISELARAARAAFC